MIIVTIIHGCVVVVVVIAILFLVLLFTVIPYARKCER